MRIKRESGALAEADMTPMIDLVFQLVAFFMIVTNFDQQQADERVKLPIDELATAREQAIKHELTVNVGFIRDPTGRITSAPLVMNAETGDIDVMTYGKMQLPKEAAIARTQGGDARVTETTVAIRADSEVPTGLVQELIKSAQEAGFSKFALKAMAGEEP